MHSPHSYTVIQMRKKFALSHKITRPPFVTVAEPIFRLSDYTWLGDLEKNKRL